LPFFKKKGQVTYPTICSAENLHSFFCPYEKIKYALNFNKTLKHQLVIFSNIYPKESKAFFFVLYNRLKIHKTWQAQI